MLEQHIELKKQQRKTLVVYQINKLLQKNSNDFSFFLFGEVSEYRKQRTRFS